MNVESRLIELIGEPGGACTPRAAATIRSPRTCGFTRGSAAVELIGSIDRSRLALVRQAREHAVDADARLHAPAARTGGDAGAPPARVRGDAGPRSGSARRRRTARRRIAARLGRAGGDRAADRSRATAAALGFAGGPTHNSLDAVSDRDFAAEIAFACALARVHLSRLGEELVLWSTTEFGFVRLGEGYCSGSSLMPQKLNPDIAELLRGKPARAIGDVVALLTDQQGPDARVQQGPAGDAGAALRRGRDRARGAGRDCRD